MAETKKKKEPKEEPPKGVESFTDVETGQPSGIMKDGQVFLGGSPKDIRAALTREAEKTAPIPGINPVGTAKESQRKMQEAPDILEQAGAFEEVEPTKTELSQELPTDIPIATPTLGAASQISGPRGLIGIARDKGWLGDLLPKKLTGEDAFPETEGTLREAALNEIRVETFNKGLTERKSFGAFMELLPGYGFIDQWVSGVVESPFEKSKDVLAEIKEIGETATNNQEKTRSGIMTASYAMNRAREMEEEIAELEGRLKLYVINSKILQANPDQVNLWEKEILDVKIRTDNFRTAAAYAFAAETTGTRIPPTDEQIFFELKDLKGGN